MGKREWGGGGGGGEERRVEAGRGRRGGKERIEEGRGWKLLFRGLVLITLVSLSDDAGEVEGWRGREERERRYFCMYTGILEWNLVNMTIVLRTEGECR